MGWAHAGNTVLRFCFDAGSVLNVGVGMCAVMWFLVLMIMRGKPLGVQALCNSGGSGRAINARCVESLWCNGRLRFSVRNLLWCMWRTGWLKFLVWPNVL